MKRMKYFGPVTATAVLAASLFLAACDTASPEAEATSSVEESSDDLATLLIADLGLDATQQLYVSSLFESQGAGQFEPGLLWQVAAELQQRLTEEQKQRLFDKAAEGPRREFGGPLGEGSWGALGDQTAVRGQRFGRHLRWVGLSGALGDILTDEQKEQARAIRESVREQLDEIRSPVDAGTMTGEEAREAILQIQESVREQIEALLTDDQKAQLESLRAERQAAQEERRAQALAVRNEVLGLSDEEAAVFDQMRNAVREAAGQIRDQARSGELGREEAHNQLLSLRDDLYEQLAGILDETQLEVVKIHDALAVRMRHHRMRHGAPRGYGSSGGAAGFRGGFGSGWGFGGRG